MRVEDPPPCWVSQMDLFLAVVAWGLHQLRSGGLPSSTPRAGQPVDGSSGASTAAGKASKPGKNSGETHSRRSEPHGQEASESDDEGISEGGPKGEGGALVKGQSNSGEDFYWKKTLNQVNSPEELQELRVLISPLLAHIRFPLIDYRQVATSELIPRLLPADHMTQLFEYYGVTQFESKLGLAGDDGGGDQEKAEEGKECESAEKKALQAASSVPRVDGAEGKPTSLAEAVPSITEWIQRVKRALPYQTQPRSSSPNYRFKFDVDKRNAKVEVLLRFFFHFVTHYICAKFLCQQIENDGMTAAYRGSCRELLYVRATTPIKQNTAVYFEVLLDKSPGY